MKGNKSTLLDSHNDVKSIIHNIGVIVVMGFMIAGVIIEILIPAFYIVQGVLNK